MTGSDRKSSVSHAATPQAIGEFWDSHSLDDSPTVREVDFEVHALRRHRVTLDPDLYEQIETEARIRGVSPETLANRWLTEKVVRIARSPKLARHRMPARRPNTYKASAVKKTRR
ncbi:MAG: hypothetical protein HY699_25020 [Deltaproteobacteria bacterium]|nr:hypothetical protein [Deltaproteobacteria bacterium]